MTPKTTVNKPLRVGFDLDGVILYNPARIIRPLVKYYKKVFLHKKRTDFYVPSTPFKQWLFRFFHKSSIFVAPGFEDIKPLVDQNIIEAYLITARFDFLKEDLDQWLKKIDAPSIFKQCYHNQKNQQPHLFKTEMIRNLNLDVFIEDNWDIVNYLNYKYKQDKKPLKVLWIYNIFDRRIKYSQKYPVLKKAVAQLPPIHSQKIKAR